MSPWLFNLHMDGVFREVQIRTLGRGVLLVSDGEGKKVSQLLFADDSVMVAVCKEKFEKFMDEFGRAYRRKKLNVYVTKRKVWRSVGDGIVGEMNIVMDGQVLEEVKLFKYLGALAIAREEVYAEEQLRV